MAGVELAFMVPLTWSLREEERDLERHRRTTDSLRRAADEVAQLAPDLLVIASPHWNAAPDLRIGGAPRYSGSIPEILSRTSWDQTPGPPSHLPPVPFDFPGDPVMAVHLCREGEAGGLPVRLEAREEALDHESIMTVMYLNPTGRIPVLPLSIEEGPKERSREWGEIIGKAIASAGRRTVFVASGNPPNDPGYDGSVGGPISETNREKDFMDRLAKGETEIVSALTNEEVTLTELEAGGLHGLYMLLGALGRFPVASVTGFRGIVGIGSSIIRFTPAR